MWRSDRGAVLTMTMTAATESAVCTGESLPRGTCVVSTDLLQPCLCQQYWLDKLWKVAWGGGGGDLPILFIFLDLEVLVHHRPARVATELVIFMAAIIRPRQRKEGGVYLGFGFRRRVCGAGAKTWWLEQGANRSHRPAINMKQRAKAKCPRGLAVSLTVSLTPGPRQWHFFSKAAPTKSPQTRVQIPETTGHSRMLMTASMIRRREVTLTLVRKCSCSLSGVGCVCGEAGSNRTH